MQYLVLNFKTYTEASGENSIELARIANNAQQNTSVTIAICPQAADIFRIREQFPTLTIWAQHIDDIEPGRNTGWLSAENLVMAGANGTLINHSEHPLPSSQIARRVEIAHQFGLDTCVAVPDLDFAKEIVGLHPNLIAFEPPELVSGDHSLLDVDASAAEQFIAEIGITAKSLLGAGIKDTSDIVQALRIGYQGVILSSGFVKAEDKSRFLQEMLSGFAQLPNA